MFPEDFEASVSGFKDAYERLMGEIRGLEILDAPRHLLPEYMAISREAI